jgi:hypothetical protein
MAYTTINKSSDYFNTKLYSGSGSVQTISGVGFQPDFTWIKNRSYTHNHVLVNAVRGSNKSLHSNTTDAETEDAAGGYLMSFNSDGFVLDGSDYGETNNQSSNYASWNWKANGAGSSNTDGSITSTVSANTTSGFSIVKWSGSGSNATIGHGLGVAPKMVITKSLGSSAWGVYNENLGNTNILFLDTTAATSAHIAYWNNTSPTSSVFSVGTDSAVNHSGNDMIAYCFSEKTGYSKFGSYTGNGNADGTFVYTGFKPAFVMIKRTSNTDNWYMKDNKRSGTAALQNFGQMNPNQTQHPSANNSNAENKASAFATDILSNGFKLRGTDAGLNQSGESYIYMCFAEAPLVGTNNVPCTAR